MLGLQHPFSTPYIMGPIVVVATLGILALTGPEKDREPWRIALAGTCLGSILLMAVYL